MTSNTAERADRRRAMQNNRGGAVFFRAKLRFSLTHNIYNCNPAHRLEHNHHDFNIWTTHYKTNIHIQHEKQNAAAHHVKHVLQSRASITATKHGDNKLGRPHA